MAVVAYEFSSNSNIVEGDDYSQKMYSEIKSTMHSVINGFCYYQVWKKYFY